MIRSFTFHCPACGSNLTIGTDQFAHYAVHPVACSCGEAVDVPTQKLFWLTIKLQKLWFDLPAKGVAIKKQPVQLKSSLFPLKVKEVPFRIKYRPESYYLRFDEHDGPFLDAPVTLIFDEEPPAQIALREYRPEPVQAWEALTGLAYWIRRVNMEMYELGRGRIAEIGFYAPSAIQRKRQ